MKDKDFETAFRAASMVQDIDVMLETIDTDLTDRVPADELAQLREKLTSARGDMKCLIPGVTAADLSQADQVQMTGRWATVIDMAGATPVVVWDRVGDAEVRVLDPAGRTFEAVEAWRVILDEERAWTASGERLPVEDSEEDTSESEPEDDGETTSAQRGPALRFEEFRALPNGSVVFAVIGDEEVFATRTRKNRWQVSDLPAPTDDQDTWDELGAGAAPVRLVEED